MSTPSPSAYITLTADQMHALQHVTGTVEVRDPEGKPVGYLAAAPAHGAGAADPDPAFGWTAQEIAKAKQALASNQRRYSTNEAVSRVKQHLSQ
jgi:hypothetical protein